ncbi:hypothetical protein [Sphingobacterium sp. DR205]|uniref:hypothetical protein n=1 Tax=Sphingobacterium sp. DR205 TaxID=2713573 RepID=UPI0019D00714|nr:hypothetical protein [Sphingobacterium sp. DR205]
MTVINFISVGFWYDNIKYSISESSLEKKYYIAHDLKIDYWGYDISANNYGVVITDNSGGLVLYKGMSIEGKGVISKLLGYYVRENRFVVLVELENNIKIIVEFRYGKIYKISPKPMIENDDIYNSFDNKELVRWLNYKNTYHIPLTLFSFILGVSVIINMVLIYRIIRILKTNRFPSQT